jgi:hypothetical protein
MASPTDTRARRFTALFEAYHSPILTYAARRLPLDAANDAVDVPHLIGRHTLIHVSGSDVQIPLSIGLDIVADAADNTPAKSP